LSCKKITRGVIDLSRIARHGLARAAEAIDLITDLTDADRHKLEAITCIYNLQHFTVQ
jgi:hypothetical protein